MTLQTWGALLVAGVSILPLPAWSMCNVIPGVVNEFRGARGIVNRPFAIPGDQGQQIELRLDTAPGGCDRLAPGFPDRAGGVTPEDDYFVTILFAPPAGGANAVVLTTSVVACQASLAVSNAAPLGMGGASCQPVAAGTDEFRMLPPEGGVPAALLFRFPDTDLARDATDDDLTFAGPAKIVVTPVRTAQDPPQPHPLPFALATARCADAGPEVLACVDELFAPGTCATDLAHRDPIFGHFTALPPPNDFEALCAPPVPPELPNECDAATRPFRFTIDRDGNALVPVDWRGVLLRPDGIPVPRIVRGETSLPAFTAFPEQPIRVPGSFVTSFSPEGHRLPPLFEPLVDAESPEATSEAILFGSVDAEIGVFRIARRLPDLSGAAPVFRQCTGGVHQGLPCVETADCPDSACGQAFCDGDPLGTPCNRDADCAPGAECAGALFDLADRFAGGTGPILIADPDYNLEAAFPVPVEGLLETPEIFAFVEFEPIADGGDEQGDLLPDDLNGDGDTLDSVLVLRDRRTGAVVPIGEGAPGRAATRVRQPPFSFPAVSLRDDVVAFLEAENAQDADVNTDLDEVDTILRVYRIDRACQSPPCPVEITQGSALPADAAPVIDGRNLAFADERLVFRTREGDDVARVVTDLPNSTIAGLSTTISSRGQHLGVIVASASPGSAALSFVDRDPDRNGIYDDPFVLNPPVADPAVLVDVSADGRNAVFGPSVTLVDRDPDGDQLFAPGTETFEPLGVGGAQRVSISADGRHVAFDTRAAVVAEDTNGTVRDVYVHDRDPSGNGVFDEVGDTRTSLVTRQRSGAATTVGSFFPSISGNGRFVVFGSDDPNLVAGDANNGSDVFVHDRDFDANGVFDEGSGVAIERVSVSSGGEEGNFNALDFGDATQSLSDDGRFVTFISLSSNLVPGDTNGTDDVFVHDRETGATERVSLDRDGLQQAGFSLGARVSAGGRFVAFDRVTGFQGAEQGDVFLMDRITGVGQILADTNLVSVVPTPARGGLHVAYSHTPTLTSLGSLGNLRIVGIDTSDTGADASRDGDLDDSLLAVLDVGTGAVTTICPAEAVSVSGSRVAFLRPESAGPSPAGTGKVDCPTRTGPGAPGDLDGDGDLEDQVVHLYEPGGAVENLEVPAEALALSVTHLGALVPSGLPGAAVPHVYDLAAGTWTPLGGAGTAIDVEGSTIVVRSADGRLRIFDGTTLRFERDGVVDFVLGSSSVAYRVQETPPDQLNGDADFDDAVLQVFDLVSLQELSTGQSATPCRFEICDPRLPYRVAGDVVTFLTLECEQGSIAFDECDGEGGGDLDGDGRSGGIVVQTFNVRKAAQTANAPAVAASGVQSAAGSVDLLAGTRAGICSDSGAACIQDTDCGGGARCFLPPGVCIQRLAGSGCDTNPALQNPERCVEGHFCVPEPVTPGRGVCHLAANTCRDDGECDAGFLCRDDLADVLRLVDPISGGPDGVPVFVSAAVRLDKAGAACASDAECAPPAVCTEAGTCQEPRPELVIAGAADSDADGIADPFDNCPLRPDASQADLDGDGAGDLCDPTTCGDGTRQPGEQCDDGNRSGGDGCNDFCLLDSDLDGVDDESDNCTLSANAGQCDSDGDGFGNHCDCDFNGDGICNFLDLGRFKTRFFATAPNLPEDLNCDGRVDFLDLGRLKSRFFQPPGPAGLLPLPAATASACGLGFELALVLPFLLWVRGRSTRRAADPGR